MQSCSLDFFSPNDKVLIFCPHPDDDILAAGGLLQKINNKGIEYRIVFLTDGENNPWPQRALEKHWHISLEDKQRWGRKRRQEALNALSILGIGTQQSTFLGLPDQGITDLLCHHDSEAIDKITQEIASWNPSVIILPSPFDLHPDHNAFALLFELALQRANLTHEPRLLYFLIHSKPVCYGDRIDIELNRYEVEAKRNALMAHESQMVLSKKRFLSYVRKNEYFYQANHSQSADNHPIKSAFVYQGALNIVLHKLTLVDLMLQPTLHIMVAAQPDRNLWLRITLLNKDHIKIFNDGGKLVGEGNISRFGDSLVLCLRHDLVGESRELLIKLRNKWGFLDCAGWKKLSAEDIAVEDPSLPYAKTIILIPCYNVADLCGEVISRAQKLADQVIVIDDGSIDDTRRIVENIISTGSENVRLIKRDVNEGKGSALLDGMKFAVAHFRFTALVTMDGDGQHRPDDIPKAVTALNHDHNFVIGGRVFSGMPLRSRFGNTLTSGLLRTLFHKSPNDTQSGFRAFSPKFVKLIISLLNKGRYETELNILLLALQLKVGINNFEIDTIYIDENRSSHFRPVIDSLRIMFSLLRWQINTLF